MGPSWVNHSFARLLKQVPGKDQTPPVYDFPQICTSPTTLLKPWFLGGRWYFLGRDPWRMSSILIGGLVISFDNWTLTIQNVNIDLSTIKNWNLINPKHGVLLQKSRWFGGDMGVLSKMRLYPKKLWVFQCQHILRGLDGSTGYRHDLGDLHMVRLTQWIQVWPSFLSVEVNGHEVGNWKIGPSFRHWDCSGPAMIACFLVWRNL